MFVRRIEWNRRFFGPADYYGMIAVSLFFSFFFSFVVFFRLGYGSSATTVCPCALASFEKCLAVAAVAGRITLFDSYGTLFVERNEKHE